MQEPRVSVCIVTYNHERYVRQCILSVLAQAQDVPLEVLVGDDLSSDGTGDIVRDLADRFPESIRYIRHATRKGPAGNLQYLIREAQGQYIAHLDGDDYWLPGKLARQVMFLGNSEDCPAVYSNAICINDVGIVIGLFNNPLTERFSLVSLLSRGNFLNHSSLMYRANLRDEILHWPPDFIDYKIHLYFAGLGDIGYMNLPSVVYRVNSSGSMLLNQNEHVRALYWEAVRSKLSILNDKKTSIKAAADFLSGVFFRAREINAYPLLSHWWQVVTRDLPCNRLLLAVMVAVTTIRRRSLSLMNKLCGKLTGVPLRIFHRR
jgi:glycosyltransferase involved in cell wall biosynthesis